MLSLARWQRVDLAGFQRLPAELKLGFTGRDGSPDGASKPAPSPGPGYDEKSRAGVDALVEKTR